MKHKNAKGFVLISMVFLMLLTGISAITLNRRAALQSQLAENQLKAIKTALGQQTALEEAIWQLTLDPMWWLDPSNKDYTGSDGVTYSRTVQKSAASGYTDATAVTVTAPGSQVPAKSAIRYYIRPPINTPGISSTIHQVCVDSFRNVYFAVKDNHVIYRRDVLTGDIAVVAGNGTSGDSGDGGPATDAQLNKPRGIAINAAGDLIIADTDNHRIKKVNSITGIITTIAGTGSSGFSGDGAAATSAELNSPRAVAVWGNDVFISDTNNHRIRRINGTTGNIETVAGTGTGGDSGDDAKADLAKIDHPYGIAFDSVGDFYLADKDNDRIRVVRYSDNKFIYAFAGTGAAGYTGDGNLAINATLRKPKGVFAVGNDVYITDTDNHVIRKVSGLTGNIYTIAGTGSAGYSGDGGLATDAQMDKPIGIYVNHLGEITASDSNNNAVRFMSASNIISSAFSAGGLGLSSPRGIRLDTDGNLYVADSSNHRILKLSTSGSVTIIAGTGSSGYTGDGGPAANAQLNAPGAIALDASGNVYIADSYNHCIRKVDAITGNISRIAGICTQSGYTGNGGSALNARFNQPFGIYVHASGDIYVADYNNCWIRQFVEGGNIDRYAGAESGGSPSCGNIATASALTTELNKPSDIFVDSNGNGYIADTDNHRIWSVNTFGQIIAIAGTGSAGYSGDGGLAANAKIDRPRGIAVDSIGNVFFTDRGKHVVRAVSAHNSSIYTLAGIGAAGYNGIDIPAITAKLDYPSGICLFSQGSNRSIYIADSNNSRIRILDLTLEKALN